MSVADNVRAVPVIPVSPLHPSLVLSAYASDLIVGARIALFGDATLSLASELAERGARLVHVFDTDPRRAAEAGAQGPRRSITFGALPRDLDPDPDEPAFDLAFVPDLSFTKEPKGLLRLARRLLSPAGSALIASPNPELLGGEGLGYYELYDAVASAFRRVRMVGQAPFVGYLLAELALTDDVAASIDTSLAGAKEPEWFIALAGQRDVRFEPYSIIELPAPPPSERQNAEPFATIPAPPPFLPEVSQEALDAARAEAEARAAIAVAERNRAILDAERASADLEQALASERRLRQALQDERDRRGALEASLARRASELSEGEAQVAALEARIRELEEMCAELSEAADRDQPEVVELEARLYERGHAIQAERQEGVRRARLVRELVSLVEEMQAGEVPLELSPSEEEEEARAVEVIEATLAPESAAVPTALADGEAPGAHGERDGELATLKSKLDNLAREAARREADLTRASWKIAELEQRLERD